MDAHMRLESALNSFQGKWVVVNRATGEVLHADPSPYALSAHVKSRGLRGVEILRCPDVNDPEVVGIG